MEMSYDAAPLSGAWGLGPVQQYYSLINELIPGSNWCWQSHLAQKLSVINAIKLKIKLFQWPSGPFDGRTQST